MEEILQNHLHIVYMAGVAAINIALVSFAFGGYYFWLKGSLDQIGPMKKIVGENTDAIKDLKNELHTNQLVSNQRFTGIENTLKIIQEAVLDKR